MAGVREKGVIVAIDGPAGAGKSTVAKLLARSLGYTLVDTGAMYRAVALAALDRSVDLDDGDALAVVARALTLAFVDGLLHVDGRSREAELRSARVGDAASRVSRFGPVRDALLGQQRALGRQGGVVLEGRDIGTVVFPDAEAKFFVTASDEERARRRFLELAARGETVDHGNVLGEIKERDRRDRERAVAPLRQADDALLVDTTGRSIEEVVESLRREVIARAQPSD